ncbi:MAG TPA: cytochrome P460 family protein [Candidatus Binatia bacterium]|nr:cytochrome P460 family protein [Candidatus Binatia bacterium]
MRDSVSVVLALLTLSVVLVAVPGSAGPEKIAFPANYKDHVLYATVDRYDNKQYRELYGTPDAVKAVREGKPIPSGTVLTLIQFKAQVDAAGNPIKDANGRFVKGELVGITVMEKRTGWGAEYPDDIRNGEWEYSAFTADQKFNDKANYKACFQCHKPHAKQDFVMSLARLAGQAPGGPVVVKTSPNDVGISGFVFGPSKVTIGLGQYVTWTNTDDSPHQVTITQSQERSAVLLKGQSHTQAFAVAGVYEYVCGLHPSMKGTVEVK